MAKPRFRIRWLIALAFIPAALALARTEPDKAEPLSVVPAKSNQPYYGNSGCAASGCHNANGPRGTPGSEYSTWANEDPHSRAFSVLNSNLGQQMTKAYRKNDKADAGSDALCLKCHAPMGVDHGQLKFDAVGCESCHGSSTQWRTTHYLNEWKSLGIDEKARRGMSSTKDVARRVEMCADCHVGKKGMEVDHDLIAAGHPRLFFEYTAYHDLLPRHWNEKSGPAFYARAWGIGRVAAAHAAVQLLHDRAAEPKRWPELAEFNCYSCHRPIGEKVTPPVGREPGSLAAGSWHFSQLDLIAALGADFAPPQPLDLKPLLAKLHDLTAKPEEISAAAKPLAAALAAWQVKLQKAGMVDPGVLKSLLAKQQPADWEQAAQHYLAISALHRSQPVSGQRSERLLLMREMLKFPPDKQGMRFNSPRTFDREKYNNAANDLFTQFNVSLQKTGPTGQAPLAKPNGLGKTDETIAACRAAIPGLPNNQLARPFRPQIDAARLPSPLGWAKEDWSAGPTHPESAPKGRHNIAQSISPVSHRVFFRSPEGAVHHGNNQPIDWKQLKANEKDVTQSADNCRRCHAEEDKVNKTPYDLIVADCYTTWLDRDPHSKAMTNLDPNNSIAKQMYAVLGDVSKSPACLTCHAVDLTPKAPTADKWFFTKLGVGCEACHGIADDWIGPHSLRDWRNLTPEQKEAKGLIDLRDPAKRAAKCASCHVGNIAEGKFVTHQMYAAGHPPLLPFEPVTFGRDQPAHWNLPHKVDYFKKISAEDAKRLYHYDKSEDYVARSLSVGAIVNLRETANTLAQAAIDLPAGQMLDFAHFDCFACHHELVTPSQRQQRGYTGVPGRPTVRTLPTELVRAVLGERGNEVADAASLLHKAYDSRPFGDPAQIAMNAKSLSTKCDEWLRQLADEKYDEAGRAKLLAAIRNAGPVDKWDYDTAQQFTWAYRVLTRYDDENVHSDWSELSKQLLLGAGLGPNRTVQTSNSLRLRMRYEFEAKAFLASWKNLR